MIARIVTRAAVVLLAAAGAFATYAAAPETASTPSPSTFSIAPPAPVVACPGPQRVPVGNVGTGGDIASQPTQRTYDAYAPTAVTPEGDGRVAHAPIAVQMERIADGDIEGWAAMTCGGAKADQWLVGGSTSLGSSARLVLSNPSTAPAEVTVTVFGTLGQVQKTLDVAVAPGSQVSKLLEAVAPELPTMVVRVQATGPGVEAAIQDSRLEGIQPAGTGWVTPSDLAKTLVVPAVGARQPDATATLRLMAPEGATVELSLVSDQGIESWSVGQSVALEAGLVTDIDLPKGLAGAIEIRSDKPVLAAARTVVPRAPREAIEGEVAYDHMWVAGEDPQDRTLTGVMPAAGARIAVYSPTNSHVVVKDSGGATVAEADVAARTVQWLDAVAPPGTVLSTTGDYAWAFVMESDSGYLASSEPIDIAQKSLSATVVAAHFPAGY